MELEFQGKPGKDIWSTPGRSGSWAAEVSEDTQSCPTLCDPMDCSLLGSSIHGIFQAIVLEWVANSFSIHPRNTSQICCFHSILHHCLISSCHHFLPRSSQMLPPLMSSPSTPSRTIAHDNSFKLKSD